MSVNSPHVNRLTRQWLRRERLEQLGEAMVADLVAVTHFHRRRSLCGLAYDAAALFGVDEEACADVGVVADLLYSAFGMVDDIQDGDVDDYLPGTVGQQLNVALALRELAVLRLVESIPPGPMLELAMRLISETALQMTLSQREELAAKAQGYRPPWDVAAYERVARGAAGAEVALLLSLVGIAVDLVGAAGVRDELMAETLGRVGHTVGVSLQIHVDCETSDERITVLPGEAVEKLRQRQAQLFIQDAPALPPRLVALLSRIVGLEGETCRKSLSQTTPTHTSTPSKTKESIRGTKRKG
jgi:hypothetical protein